MKTINKIILGIGLLGITYSCTDLEEDLLGDLTSDFSVEGISTGGSGGGEMLLQEYSTLSEMRVPQIMVVTSRFSQYHLMKWLLLKKEVTGMMGVYG